MLLVSSLSHCAALALALPASTPAPSLDSVIAAYEPQPGLATTLRAERGTRGNLFGLLGARQLDDTPAWRPLDEPFVFAVEAEFHGADSILGPEIGLSLAADGDEIMGIDVQSAFAELYVGLRLTGTFGSSGSLHPYVGAGGSFVFADITGVSGLLEVSDDDVSFGAYVHAGIYWTFGRAFSLGVDGRVLAGTDVELLGVSTDADYEQLALLFGVGF